MGRNFFIKSKYQFISFRQFAYLTTLFWFLARFASVGVLNSRSDGSRKALVCVSESGLIFLFLTSFHRFQALFNFLKWFGLLLTSFSVHYNRGCPLLLFAMLCCSINIYISVLSIFSLLSYSNRIYILLTVSTFEFDILLLYLFWYNTFVVILLTFIFSNRQFFIIFYQTF